MGISAQYLPDSSPDINTAYCLAKAQVNLAFTQFPLIYEIMIYNLAGDILINIAQDYSVAINSISWSANVATVVTAVANTFISGQFVTVSGAFPVGFNATAQATVVDSTHFRYPLIVNPGTLLAPGNAGFNLFAAMRAQWHLTSFVGGVIQSSADESTSESLAVPKAIQEATLNDLQLFKTSYGRTYLSYAQRFGTLWGIS